MSGYGSSYFRHNCHEPRAIRPTDVDGLVEVNSHFLFLEEKAQGKSLEEGQSSRSPIRTDTTQ